MNTTAARIRNNSLVSERSKAEAAPWKLVTMLAGMPDRPPPPAGWPSTASPSEPPARHVEGDRVGGELAQVIDEQGLGAQLDVRDGRERHLAARGRGHIDLVERLGRQLHAGAGLHDHPVLVGLGEDGGDDPLAEGVVERAVDRGGGDAEARGRVAVDDDVGAARPCWAWSVATSASCGSCWSRSISLGIHSARAAGIRAFEHHLVLGAADAVVDRQVLDRLHVGRDPDDAGDLRLQALDDLGGAELAIAMRLEVHQHPAAVERSCWRRRCR